MSENETTGESVHKRLHDGVAQDIAIIQAHAARLTRLDPDNKDAAAIAKAAQRAADEVSQMMREIKSA